MKCMALEFYISQVLADFLPTSAGVEIQTYDDGKNVNNSFQLYIQDITIYNLLNILNLPSYQLDCFA